MFCRWTVTVKKNKKKVLYGSNMTANIWIVGLCSLNKSVVRRPTDFILQLKISMAALYYILLSKKKEKIKTIYFIKILRNSIITWKVFTFVFVKNLESILICLIQYIAQCTTLWFCVVVVLFLPDPRLFVSRVWMLLSNPCEVQEMYSWSTWKRWTGAYFKWSCLKVICSRGQSMNNMNLLHCFLFHVPPWQGKSDMIRDRIFSKLMEWRRQPKAMGYNS